MFLGIISAMKKNRLRDWRITEACFKWNNLIGLFKEVILGTDLIEMSKGFVQGKSISRKGKSKSMTKAQRGVVGDNSKDVDMDRY